MAPDRLWFTDSDEANALNAQDPMALLIGFAIDQQVPVQKAFSGPLVLKQRVGTLDPQKLAAMDLDDAFRERPAIHRFPGAMAERVRELAALVAEEYGGKAERVWTEAADADDLRRRIGELPGFGQMKITALGSVLAKRYGVPQAQGLRSGPPDARRRRLRREARLVSGAKAGAQGKDARRQVLSFAPDPGWHVGCRSGVNGIRSIHDADAVDRRGRRRAGRDRRRDSLRLPRRCLRRAGRPDHPPARLRLALPAGG